MNGYLDGGIDAGKTSGLPVETSDGIDLDALKELSDETVAPIILGVRQRNECHAGHIQGALNIELGELQEHLDGLPREIPVVNVCAAGMRASMAGRILEARRAGKCQGAGFRRYSGLDSPGLPGCHRGRVSRIQSHQSRYGRRGLTGFSGSCATSFMATRINNPATNPPIWAKKATLT